MSMSAQAIQSAIAMNDTIVAQAEKIAEMQRVIDGAAADGVYRNNDYWWNELKRLATPNIKCSGLATPSTPDSNSAQNASH